MKCFPLLKLVFFLLLIQCQKKENQVLHPINMVSDNYHDIKIDDPYRYMEDLEDSSVINWLKDQEKIAQKSIDKIPGRNNLLKKINNFNSSKSFIVSQLTITDNDVYFYLKKMPDDKMPKLFYRKTFSGKEKLLFDPKNYKPKSNNDYLINYIQPSWDAKKIAISITKNDEEISEIVILDINSNKLHDEIIDHCWPSDLGGIHWLNDNSGFIYTHIPVVDKNQENYILNTASVLYKLGDDPKKLNILYSKSNNPELNLNPEDFSIIYYWRPEHKYLVAKVGGIGFKDYYYCSIDDINKDKINWKPLFKKEDMIRQFFIDGETLFFRTAKNASNFKICKTSFSELNFNTPDVLVNESPLEVITDFTLTKNGLFYVKTKNGVEAKLYKLEGENEIEIPLPKPSGSIEISSKNSDYENLWIKAKGWSSNMERYSYNFKENSFIEENLSPLISPHEFESIVVQEIEIRSYDGVQVPLSIIYKKGINKNGNNRVLLNGYGAYKWSNSPNLHPYLLHWVREGGVYAVAHVRGGGEKGNAWHKAGFKTTKPNTWKDFIACTEYLINEGFTTSNKMAVWGASAGGINIGRAITERPDLYAAAIIRVGLLNTSRLDFSPNGLNNTKEFGTIKDSLEYRALIEMDAYQHIKNGEKYPAVYLTAGMNDARVVPWQPAKFAARLQAVNTSDKPILLSVDFEGGHGFNAANTKKSEELVDVLSFALWQTGHPDYQPK